MNVAMKFEDDIFISYAHLDNVPPFEDQPGWVSRFHRSVEIRVAQLLGKKPKIWRDQKLQGNDIFAQELVDRLAKVATLVCVLSESYVQSSWCNRELDEFWKNATGDLSAAQANRVRVFKVVKMPVPPERHPPPVKPLLGYDFYKLDPETGTAMELDPSVDPALGKDYWVQVNTLSDQIAKLLRSLSEGPGPEPPPGDRSTVYLAHTSFDLKDEHDAIRRDLLRHGHRVLPDVALPLNAEELKVLVGKQLTSCQLAVHLIGRNFGVVPEGSNESVVSLQNSIAAEYCGVGKLRRLIWMPPGLEAKDERQRELIAALKNDERTYRQGDLLETSLEDLKTVIHQQLETLRSADAAPPRKPPGEVIRLYLICDQRDLEQTRPLEDYLFNQGLEVILPVFEEDEKRVRLYHEQNLSSCEAFLFYFGAGDESWLRSNLRDLDKSSGYGRERPLLGSAVYVAPPSAPRKEHLHTHLATVIRPQGDFDPADLQPFLSEIRNARARHTD
jgi:hypothetical protein